MSSKNKYYNEICGGKPSDDPDITCVAKEFYKEQFPEHIYATRGETWFTPIALLWTLGKAAQINKLCADFDNNKMLVKEFKLELISKISKIIMSGKTKGFTGEIGIDYHSLANFGCQPASLNTWRGFNNSARLGDFPDLYLECVRNWFIETEPEKEGVIGYSVTERDKLDEHKDWFKGFGCGFNGWKNFVSEMKFKGNFVKDDYTIEYLFEHKIGKPYPILFDAENEHAYTFDTLAAALSANPEVCGCIRKIYGIWERRVDLLSQGQ